MIIFGIALTVLTTSYNSMFLVCCENTEKEINNIIIEKFLIL
jgi:hypothetical protein